MKFMTGPTAGREQRKALVEGQARTRVEIQYGVDGAEVSDQEVDLRALAVESELVQNRGHLVYSAVPE